MQLESIIFVIILMVILNIIFYSYLIFIIYLISIYYSKSFYINKLKCIFLFINLFTLNIPKCI